MATRKISKLNLLLAVEKPVGCTSHDLVAQVRRAVGERRVGHAGTLDPMASGVMLVGIGQATRLLGKLTLDTKSYIANISFGAETNTDDAEGEVTRRAELSPELSDPAFAERALEAFHGSQMQVPPAFSAISVNGVRAYKSARAGESVELEPRPVEVIDQKLIAISGGEDELIWTVAFTVSKGTYIRALARDLGRSVASAAHISALQRTASGCIQLKDCIRVEDLNPERAAAASLDPVCTLGMPLVEVPERTLPDVLNGRRISLADARCGKELSDGDTAAAVVSKELRALGVCEGGFLRPTDVFPQGITGVRP